MKLGIYIGSFNPPHKGHIHIVNYLLNNKIVNRVLIVPTGNYWDKQDLIEVKHRINMLKYYQSQNIKIDTENNKYVYTYELMRVLKNKYKRHKLYLIIGADNIINFDKWKNYEELLKYQIIIMNRNNIDIKEYTNKYLKGKFIILNNFPYINISSTEIRNNLTNKYLDIDILNYIKNYNLYKEEK